MTAHTEFDARVIKLGIATMGAGVIANFVPVLYMWFVYDTIPPFTDILKIWAVATAAFGASWTVQIPSYFPVLGMGGTYIAFLVGSVAEIRLPASAMAQKVNGSGAGLSRKQGDFHDSHRQFSIRFRVHHYPLYVIGAAVIPHLPALVQKSFNYVLPALFSAVLVEFSISILNWGFPLSPLPQSSCWALRRWLSQSGSSHHVLSSPELSLPDCFTSLKRKALGIARTRRRWMPA